MCIAAGCGSVRLVLVVWWCGDAGGDADDGGDFGFAVELRVRFVAIELVAVIGWPAGWPLTISAS